MARTSNFGDRRSKLAFDRVESDQSSLSDRAFGLSAGFEGAGEEFQSITWVYDIVNDEVVWSRPLD